MQALEKNTKFAGRRGPVVLVIMDGVGIGKYKEGDDQHLAMVLLLFISLTRD